MHKVLGVLLAGLCALTGSSGSASAATGNVVRILVAGQVEDPSATIVAAGVITGLGSLTAEAVDFRPADKTYHETDLLTVGGGTLTMAIDGAFDVWPFTLDPRTCTQQGTLSGTWIVMAGGGDFAGATGQGTFSGRFLTYASRGPAGCDDEAIKGFVAGPMVGSLRLASTRST